jgi:seryl-tRNA(Sec) selenium transferase
VVHSHDELKSAFKDKTAMVYTTARGDRLEKAIPMTKEARVPILVDWAAGIPPIENLALPWKMGADLYTFSGGKGLCGPQCSGLLLGRKVQGHGAQPASSFRPIYPNNFQVMCE